VAALVPVVAAELEAVSKSAGKLTRAVKEEPPAQAGAFYFDRVRETWLQVDAARTAKFIQSLQRVLNAYCDERKRTTWGDRRWNAARRKLNNISENCEPYTAFCKSERMPAESRATPTKL
jgi:hypothetical protein